MTEFTSLLLDRPVALVEPFGEPEPSFIGGGRTGAGGTPDGAWDFLIGPTYSSPNFLHEERLSVGWHGGRNRPVAPAMHRVAGSGLLCGRQRLGDLDIEVWDVAPWDGQEVLRVVAVANRGRAVLRRLRVQAFVRAPGKPVIQGQVLHVALPQGTPSYGGECPSWAERTARIAWNRPANLCNDWRDNVGTGIFLACELGDLTPGATAVATLVHRLDEGASLPALDLPVDPAALVKRELAAWQEWFGRGIAATRGDVLVESQLAFIRMEQSFDGGFIAGVRRYAYSYIRDMHGACRGLLAAGHADEGACALAWIDRKVRRFGTVVNASEMGADVRDFVGGHKGTELPAYYLLMAVSLLRHGRAEAVDACRATLTQAADEQIAVSRADGWRFHYNGDETERYVPVVDGANYLFGKPDWDPKRAVWSMPSHVLAMASVDAFVRVLAPRWGIDPAPYRAAVDAWRASFAPTFQPDGRAVPAWTVFPDGTLPSYPVPNYLLFAAWVDAPFAPEQVRAWVEAAEACLDPVRGRVPVCPGAVEGTCGHDLALLLYGLKRIGAPGERIKRIETLIRQGGSLQWFGLVNEFYGPDGTPNQHNLRPFETGPLAEALIVTNSSTYSGLPAQCPLPTIRVPMNTNTLTLADDKLKLEFSSENGALTGVTALETGWKILDRPHLGLSFRLFVPKGRRRNNPVDGEKHKLTSFSKSADGKALTFVWDGVDSPHAGRLDIRVEITVRLDDGKAIWACTLVNRSGLVIEAAYVPYFGDLRPAVGATGLRLTGNGYVEPWSTQLWPKFNNHKGYFGVDYPTAMHGAHYNNMPMNPFFTLTDDSQGLYIGVEGRAWEYVVPQAEARPGYSRSIDGTMPAGDRISQHEVSTRLGLIHFPYVQPGETRALQPIGIAHFQGQWTAAADIYRRSSVQPKAAATPAWLREPHSWIQIQVNSPEGEARTRYKDLVPLAEEMARHGITGMQITGWNFGGQDQDNPTHDTDPLLGTWEEFRDAIRQIRALGVKVILFAKFTWADQATEWFQRHLKRLAVTDPWGDYYQYRGYQYHTPMQLQDISTKRLIPMCLLSEEYLKICEAEFRKILDLGADGFLYDECQHHGNAALCFHPDHGHRPGALVYGNDLHLIERFRALAAKVRPDFCFAGEAIWDWEFSEYHLSYFRTERTNHTPWFRYVRPGAAYMTAVTGFDDREMIAQCLMCRYIISYEPFNFKGRPEDYPLTLAYGKQMDALRTELRRWFWDGEFRHTQDAAVTGADGKAHHPYGVFRPQDGGAPGVAIANYEMDRTVTVTVSIPGQDLSRYRYRLIDDATWKPAAKGVVIPARGCAVVVPQ